MKRLLRLLILLALLVAAGGFALHALHARRAAARDRDRELAELLAGPLLPGVPDTDEFAAGSGI